MGKAAPPPIRLPIHALLREAVVRAGPHYQSGDRVVVRLYGAAVAAALGIPPGSWEAVVTALGGRHSLERALAPRIDDIRVEIVVEQAVARGRR